MIPEIPRIRCLLPVMLMLLVAGVSAPFSKACAETPGRHVQTEFEDRVLNGWLTEVEHPKATIVMLHGTLAHANMEIMSTLAEVFAEYGFETLRVSLSLGLNDRYGMLACDQTQRHRHADAIAELATWVSWLEDQGRQSFLLLGHSRGTNQVARYATTESQVSPAGLILVAPPVWDAVAASDAYAERAGQPLEPLVARATQLVKSDQGDETLDDVVFLHCAEARVTAASFLSYYGMDPAFDTLALTDRSQLPVIIFAGTDDPLTRGLPPAVEAMDDGERVEFVTIEGADHFFRDLYAYDLVEAVEAWLTDRQM